jgi:hypothetical protein
MVTHWSKTTHDQAMADSTLSDFIRQSLAAGASRQAIEQALHDAGWTREQIRSALDGWADVEFPVPVPRPSVQLSARDAFRYLTLFVMLYFSAYHFGRLLFQFINLAFPDPLALSYGDVIGSRIRWSTSALLVAFPVFLFVARRIARDVARDPVERNSAVRRWLTYLTLAIAACILVGDLISLLYGILSRALTLPFLLKGMVVMLIAGGLFGYFLWSLRRDDEARAR